MQAATAASPQAVTASYQVTGSLPGPVALDVYRSPAPSFGPGAQLAGQEPLSAADLASGTHQVTVSLSNPLDINPSEKYVLVIAHAGDPAGPPAAADSSVSFRTWIVGAVTHGYQPDGQFPSWVQSTADALKADGYDSAVAFNWAVLSALPAAGTATLAGQEMATAVDQAIAALPVQPGDVVDVHLIGHSRGGDVVSLAAGLLDRSRPPLAGGDLKLTLLDPHPARNGPVTYASWSNGPIGTLTHLDYLAFQAAANDPPLTIPPGVNQTEIFYQQTTVTDGVLPDEQFLLNWGEVPAGGATAGVTYYNLTGIVNSHQEIHDYYLQQIVPLLAIAAPLPIAPSPVPVAPAVGGPAFADARIGTHYELQLARSSGVPAPVATHLLRSYSTLNALLAHRRFGQANAQINSIGRLLAAQSGRGIPALAATYLQGELALTRLLLFPHPPVTIAARARS
jgi:hypothetical protein